MLASSWHSIPPQNHKTFRVPKMITSIVRKAVSTVLNWGQGTYKPPTPIKFIGVTRNDSRWVPYIPGNPPCCPDCHRPLFQRERIRGCLFYPLQWDCRFCPAIVNFCGHEREFGNLLARAHRIKLANRPLTQLDFWTDLESYISEHGSPFKNIKPKAQRWIDIGIGITGVKLRVVISYDVIYSDPWVTREPNDLKVELYFSGSEAKNRFNSFYVRRKQVERDLERNLMWQESRRYSVCRISSVAEMDLDKRYSWPGHISCIVEDLNDFYQYFRPIIREL